MTPVALLFCLKCTADQLQHSSLDALHILLPSWELIVTKQVVEGVAAEPWLVFEGRGRPAAVASGWGGGGTNIAHFSFETEFMFGAQIIFTHSYPEYNFSMALAV